MSRTLLRARCLFAALVALPLVGCITYYRAETVLHADGSVDRAIYQPAANEAQLDDQRSLWTELRAVNEIDDSAWRAGIPQLPAQVDPDREERAYRAAWGHFSSAAALPAHTRFPTPDGKEAGELVRKYERTEFGLVTEHLWEETLTDVVTLPGARRATDHLVTSMAGDLDYILARGLGEEYDREPLLAWVHRDGRRWLHEAVAALYDVAGRQYPDSERKEQLVEQLIDISVAYGLDLRDEHGELRQSLSPAGQQLVLESMGEFVKQKLRTLLRRRDGTPVPNKVWNELDTLVDELIVTSPNEARDHTPSAVTERWREIARAMVTDRYDTPKHYEELISTWLCRIVGVYSFPLQGEARFRYTMTVPGIVVETTGRMHSENSVSWTFVAMDAFPFGKRMMCRSLAADPELQRRVLGAERLTSRVQLTEYVELVQSSELLRGVMRQCVQQGSLAELKSYRQRLQEGQDQAGLDTLTRLEELLQATAP